MSTIQNIGLESHTDAKHGVMTSRIPATETRCLSNDLPKQVDLGMYKKWVSSAVYVGEDATL